jgi:predicted ester cyclase
MKNSFHQMQSSMFRDGLSHCGGPTGYLSIIEMMRGGFPDIRWTLEEMVAEGDTVAARFTMRGAHRGTFFGVPPTGKSIAVQAMNFYRLSGGKFVEERGRRTCSACYSKSV